MSYALVAVVTSILMKILPDLLPTYPFHPDLQFLSAQLSEAGERQFHPVFLTPTKSSFPMSAPSTFLALALIL